ncbi:MAG: type II toxin-antitoxin system HicB family antitoxin [bacterium]
MSLRYKGYTGHVEFDDQARIFHGEVLGTRDVITFQGQSVGELEKAFRESIDVYLEWCKEEGINPDKPFSGQLRLRLGGDLHRRVAQAAQQTGQSINELIVHAIEKSLPS